ncbi:hypothetical protein [Streptomyces massasporeus]|uniref:hypothetical protein n=1 Tax=Streptomyces massasporeus TaxID=67324 RepID=UPI001673C996|nr:hypothetical protein [Streptomyces massasporeus]GGV63462.1 hypothetical protein GCM10010228_13360 [Streptomyces massasporeus]
MCALPARRIASGALCAALLVGITGPVAMAADSSRGHGHVAPEARLPGADARLAQVGKRNWGELAPVADLLRTVLRDSNGRLPAAEARRLGDAAKAALAEAAANGAGTSLMSTVVRLPAPALPAAAPGMSVPRAAADPVTDLLDLVLGAVDGLLEAITSAAGGVLPSVDGLLTGVDDLLAALTAGELSFQDESDESTPSDEVPGESSTSDPAETAVTLPDVPLLTPVLPPTP